MPSASSMNPEGAAARVRAVLDTNIYIAAFGHPSGSTAKLWSAALTGQYCLLISPPMIRELAKVLRSGLCWQEERIQGRIPSPSARANHAMAYDANIGQVVLFGGDSPNGGRLNDTWTWNGTTWSQIETSFTPSARSGASMNYDPNFKGLVLFGGFLADGSFTNTTWLLVP